MVVNGREINNQWVVPYNRYMCYASHINVEHVAGVVWLSTYTSIYKKVMIVLLLYLELVQPMMAVSNLAT